MERLLQLKVITGTPREVEFEVNDFLKFAYFNGITIKSAQVDPKATNATIWYEENVPLDE